MRVFLEFFGRFRKELGQKKVEWSFDYDLSLRELLKYIENKTKINLIPDFIFPDFTPRRSIILLIDGTELSVFKDIDLKLWDNVEITLLPAIHGGLN